MKIAFLHLSDIHFTDKADYPSIERAEKIIESLHQLDPFDVAICVVSGDIVFSGQQNEYKIASRFLDTLLAAYGRHYPRHERLRLQIVPGNHDVDFSKSALTHEALQQLYDNKLIDESVQNEYGKQQNYLAFSKNYGSFSLCRRLFCQKIVSLNGYRIEINLLNSALFSMKDQEKGMHYLPERIVKAYRKPTGADLVVTVMHHSFHWFNDEQKATLEKLILAKSSLVFFGHEHDLGTQRIDYGSLPSTRVFSGGELANKNNWSNSVYCACVLDTDTMVLGAVLKCITPEYHASQIMMQAS